MVWDSQTNGAKYGAHMPANTNNAAYQFLKRVTCGDSTHDTNAYMTDLCFFCAYLGADVAKLSWGAFGEPADWNDAQGRFNGLFDAFESESDARDAIASEKMTPQKLADSAAEWLAQHSDD